MVKAKKAALGAMVMSSSFMSPNLFGLGEDTIDAQPEVSILDNARSLGT